MDAGGLHKLAKALRQIGMQATSDPGEALTGTELLLATDVFEHSPTTVSEIAQRTGIVQSQVSAFVAQMREAGVLVGHPDPADRRRNVLTVTAKGRTVNGRDRGRRDPRPAIRAYLNGAGKTASEQAVDDIMLALDELASRLGLE